MEINIAKIFNDCYRFYLNGIPDVIFLNIFLEQSLRLINCDAGFIGTLHARHFESGTLHAKQFESENTDKIIINAVFNNNEFMKDDNYDLFFDISSDKYCYKALLENNIITTKPDDIDNKLFELGFGRDITYCPIGLNNPVGVFGIIKDNDIVLDHKIIRCISHYLYTLLQVKSVKIEKIEVDKKMITYKLTEDILNTIHHGIIVTDKDFFIVYSNDCANSIIKTLYADLYEGKNIDNNLLNIFPQLKVPLTMGDKGLAIFKNRKIELAIKDKISVVNIQFGINSIITTGIHYNVIILNIAKDDTKNNQGNENFSKHRNLIAYLSHELRNPLQTITLANHLIQTHTKNFDFPQKVKNNFGMINKVCIDMKKIINDILDLSRLEAKEFALEMSLVDILEIVEDTIEENRYKAEEKGLKLDYNISSKVPKTLYTDYTRLCQILNNLISNAIKYSDSGTIKVSVDYDEKKHGVIFSVIDEGLGIHENEIGNLFKEYGQTSNSFKFSSDSNGLGLCISQKISNLLGGYITVKSEHNKGSKFILFHPIKLGNSGSIFQKNISVTQLNGKILLVDDNESNLLLFKMLLENFNYEYNYELSIECVTDGKDAIELCKVNNYDIIFMDINMQKIDGCTASKIISINGYSGKIIATTGNILAKKENRTNEETDRYKYFSDVLIKPFDDNIVNNMLKKYLVKID